MSLKSSLRWALYDRGLALVPFLLGLLIALAGLYLGAGAYLQELAVGDPSDAGSPASAPLVIVGIVLGFLVWQIGRSAARHHAMQTAIDQRIEELVDEEHIASAAAKKVDDRIADVETDVQQVSRKTTKLEQEMRGDELTEDAFDDGPTATGGADPADAAAAGTTAATGAGGATGDAETVDAAGTADAAEQETGAAANAAGDETQSTGSAAEADATTDTAAASDAGGSGGSDDADDGDSDADTASDDGFEWEDDTDDGEYYRNT